ncbi:hypothetical protein PSTT_14762 [Puccinia striiformis]|uniref:Peptidase A2 domain-containing protein n=1 Tax=Puccinia striiformis TaxID=27350 RepID=A0A2S4UL63_9BASI|nr:hypothetical protein PSTT_14762 [Puccinia striiformis]
MSEPTLRPSALLYYSTLPVQRKCLIDTGSAIDIITETAMRNSSLIRRDLTRPIKIKLALHESKAEPIFLRHFTLANIHDPRSGLSFPKVPLRIGPINGDYDLILGAPFLTRFDLVVSMRNQWIRCETSHKTICDYRVKRFICYGSDDIPAISEEEEDAGLFTDGSFPKKLQPV